MINIFNNKKIALVGNAKSLVYSDYGLLIDNHDIVCRINKGYNMIPPYSDLYTKSHGTKFDILFLNLFKTSGITNRLNNFTKIYQTGTSTTQEEFASLVDYNILKDDIVEIQKHFSQKPSTGLRALWLLSKSSAYEISVFGFDWKESPSFWNLRHDNNAYEHDFLEEKNFCLTHFTSDSRIKFYLSKSNESND